MHVLIYTEHFKQLTMIYTCCSCHTHYFWHPERLCILSVEEISSYLPFCRTVNHVNAHIITMSTDSLHQQTILEELQWWIIDSISYSWQTFIWNAVVQSLPLSSPEIDPNVNYSIQQIKIYSLALNLWSHFHHSIVPIKVVYYWCEMLEPKYPVAGSWKSQ